MGHNCVCQAEVGHLRSVMLIDENVVGLEVAVDKPGLVRCRQSPARLDVHVNDLPPRRLAAVKPAAKRVAHHQFHHDESTPLGQHDVVDRDHVGVSQPRHRLGLREQPVPDPEVGVEHGVVQQLDCHLPVEATIERAIDHPHTPSAEGLAQLEAISQGGCDLTR